MQLAWVGQGQSTACQYCYVFSRPTYAARVRRAPGGIRPSSPRHVLIPTVPDKCHAMVSVVAAVSVKNAVLVVLEALLIRLDSNRDWLTRHGNSECRLVVVRH